MGRSGVPAGAAALVPALTPAFWGEPVLEDGFDGERVDTSKWLVHHFPDAPVNPRTRTATSVTDGTLKLPNALTFWIDGRKVWSYWGPLTPERSQMGLALQNDQVCDRGPSFCRNRSTPKWVTMYVDRVRVYRAPR
ncbi:hypothetical protein GCM10009678_60760 [Actinomadura kijaniata]|uniref:Uncharacterized protein n=1 Tax=Actinomadura namibiensis TaxID=182080 RepID=A0A7W3QIM8_ACTNM|nr:hypothetical protein [Actinomadura namibiensis]MBA8948460.1 hypothetical protein [Actinomadura namibiensis]